MPNTALEYTRMPLMVAPDASPILPYRDWVPSCKHWTILTKSSLSTPIAQITTGMFRRYLQRQIRKKKQKDGKLITISGEVPIPFAVDAQYLPPSLWKEFWALPLPHRVVTIWWRLLQDKISYQVTLNRWNPETWPSSICDICQALPESNQHFFVSCSKKWSFWQTVLEELTLGIDYPNPDSVWTVLYTLHNSKNESIEDGTLLSFSIILETLWRYHWQCIYSDPSSWSQEAILALYHSSISKKICVSKPVYSNPRNEE